MTIYNLGGVFLSSVYTLYFTYATSSFDGSIGEIVLVGTNYEIILAICSNDAENEFINTWESILNTYKYCVQNICNEQCILTDRGNV